METPPSSSFQGRKIYTLLQGLFTLFHDSGKQLYLVGGCVRDVLMGRDTSDYDMATDAGPEETVGILASAGYTVIPLGIEFGTVGTLAGADENEQVQITTFRTEESYRKGSRHPDVVFGNELEEDLQRRDFTVNCMAMDSMGRVIDPLNGQGDLEAGILRTPLDPGVTFREDPLRMLRAYRFSCRLGFDLDRSVAEAICNRHALILEISKERWKMEMDRLLTVSDGEAVAATLDTMRRHGILQDMIPELEPVFSQDHLPQGPAHYGSIWLHTLDVITEIPPETCLRWSALLHDIGKPLCRTEDDDGRPHYYDHQEKGRELALQVAERFRFSRKERNCVCFLVSHHMRPVLYSDEWSERAVRKLAVEAGEYLQPLLKLARSDIAAHSEHYAVEGSKRMDELEERLHIIAPSLNKRVLPGELGHALHKLVGSELESEAQIGDILERLRELVFNGKLREMEKPEYYLEYLRGDQDNDTGD